MNDKYIVKYPFVFNVQYLENYTIIKFV